MFCMTTGRNWKDTTPIVSLDNVRKSFSTTLPSNDLLICCLYETSHCKEEEFSTNEKFSWEESSTQFRCHHFAKVMKWDLWQKNQLKHRESRDVLLQPWNKLSLPVKSVNDGVLQSNERTISITSKLFDFVRDLNEIRNRRTKSCK